jgi:hypothetical protein
MSSFSTHPDPETLVRLVDDDLSAADAGRVREHLTECSACRERTNEIEGLCRDLQTFHQSVIKPGFPDPPRQWGNPRWSKLAKPFPTRRYLAAAAAVLAAIVLLRWIERPSEVSAAELLHKAEIQEQTAQAAPRRIRIRSKNRSWTRPARLTARPQAGDAVALAAMLEDAGYPLDDPLSAASFAAWRDRQPAKKDEVEKTATAYVVTTSTQAGTISEASLILRAGDLYAVSVTLRFRSDEVLDLSEAPAEMPGGAPPTLPHTPPKARLSEELHVIAALHDIRADLGDPIEVKRNDDSIDVTVGGLNALRQEQIRASLSGIAGVHITFEQQAGRGLTSPTPSRAPVTNPTNPLIPDINDALIDASDRVLERAHALAALARRFPAATEASLDDQDRTVLRRIAADHLDAISLAARQLRAALKTTASSDVHAADWHDTAEEILRAAMEADQELNSSGSDVEGRLARLRAAVARLP